MVTLLIYLLSAPPKFLPNVALTLVLASFAHAFFTGFLGFENHVEMLASPAAGSLQITCTVGLEQFRMLFGTALASIAVCLRAYPSASH